MTARPIDIREALARAECARVHNRRAGRAAKAAGDSDEARVLGAARCYSGRVSIRKMPTPVVRLRASRGLRPGQFVAVYDPDGAGCDFRGEMQGGRAIVFEAKGSSTASLPLRRKNGKPTLTDRQRAELQEAHHLGAIAAVLVKVTRTVSGRPAPEWWWLSWPAWKEAERLAMADRGGRSMSPEHMEQAGGVRCGVQADGAPDWPAVVLGEGV